MKFCIMIFCIALITVSCGNKLREEYEAFKKDARPLTACKQKEDNKTIKNSTINNSKTGKLFIIELKENPSTGYLWYHKISDKKVLIPFGKKAFDFSEKGTVGNMHTVIWKFKTGSPGKTEIVFKYYRNWEGEKNAIREKSYKISVQ